MLVLVIMSVLYLYGSWWFVLYLLTPVFDEIDWNLVIFDAFQGKSWRTQVELSFWLISTIYKNDSLFVKMLWCNLPMRTLQEQELLKYPWRTGCVETTKKTPRYSINLKTPHFSHCILNSSSLQVHLGLGCHPCLGSTFATTRLSICHCCKHFWGGEVNTLIHFQQPIGCSPGIPPTYSLVHD